KLGGDSGETLTLAAGDVVVLPAGTGHCRLSDGRGLVVMGGYPKGQEHYDICRSLAERPDWAERIGNVALPRTDPVFGEDGALLKLWRVG
ncbi:MAG: cupin, partial [Devosia sp.]